MKLTNMMFLLSENNTTRMITFDNKQFTINRSTTSIFETCCLNYGITLKGSIQAIKHHLTIRQKCPVLLSVKHQLMFFLIPLVNPTQKLWIRYVPSMISKRVADHQCVVSFTHQKVTLSVDNRMVVRQIKRCQDYIDILNAYDLEYGLLHSQNASVCLEDILKSSTFLGKEFS